LARKIFREAALEKMSSHERLDALMQVTTTKGWIALLASIVVIVAALLWGFWGSAPDNVHGGGILLREGGVFNIEASGSGVIGEIAVDVGDPIGVGDVIATISLPVLEQTIRQQKQRIAGLESNRERTAQLVAENRDLQIQSIQEDLDRLQKSIEALREEQQYLQKRLDAQQQAVELGLITDDVAQATARELSTTRTSIIGDEAQLAQLQAQEAAVKNRAAQDVFNLDQQIAEVESQLALNEQRRALEAETRSEVAGDVVALLQDKGSIVQRGAPIMTIELTATELRALVFVPLEGSRIQPDMAVQISPEGVTWEEYGYMLGTVISVSAAPLSPQAINRLLRNDSLVQQFSANGGVYLVEVRLELDAATPTGFKWTSRQGPHAKIGTGTLLTAKITVNRRAPIELVIPALRRWLGS